MTDFSQLALARRLGLLFGLTWSFSLSAQTTNTWTGGGTNNNWSAPANWGGTAPVSGDALTFSGTVRQTNTNDVASLANLNTVTFNSAGWNINGDAVSVATGFAETAAGSNTWGLATTMANTINISQSATGDVLNFTGILSGPGGITTVAGVGGVGVIYLSNTNNSFTGNVSINSATAVIYSLANPGQNSSLGAGSGTVTFGSTTTSYEGTLIYAGATDGSTSRAFEGEARTTGSPAFCNNSPNNSSLTFNGGWSARGDLDPFTLLLQGSSTGTNTFNGSLSQSSPPAVSVQVNGPGTWVFAANNSYTGTTTLNGGVLQLGGGGTTGNAGPSATNSIIFASNSTLAVNRSDSPVFVNNITLSGADAIAVGGGRTATLGGVISGSGALVVDNAPGGILILTNANTYSGNTTVNSGRLALGAAGSLPNSPVISLSAGAVIDVSAVSGGFSLGAGQTLNGSGSTGTINGALNMGSASLALSFVPGTPVLAVTGGALTLNNNPVSLTVAGNSILPPGSYELIAPGTGGSVTGSVGSSIILANDLGDQSASLAISNGGLWLVVNPSTATIPTAITLTSSPNPSTYGTVPATFAATASPAPTNGELITFMDGTNILAVSALANGTAAFSTASLALGTHFITAVYGGDGLFLPGASSVLTQVVNQAAVCYPQGRVFPLLMYEITPAYTNLAACGWNIMQEYGLNTNSDVNTFLQELLSSNLAGPAIIPDSGSSDPYTEWPQAAVQSWVESIAVNTNLAWWYLPEQMEPFYPSETNLLHDYTDWTRLYDPARRPTYEYTENSVNDSTMKGIIPYADVIGVSCYCEDMGMPHAWVRYKLQQAGLGGAALAGAVVGSNYLAGQKTLVAVLSIAQFTNNSPSEPSPAQTYHDVWSAIASGAQGIAVWSCFHALNDDPANLTNNLNELDLAASQLTGPQGVGGMILNGTPNSNVTFKITSGPTNTVSFTPPGESSSFQYPSLNVLSKTWNGFVYIIAVNSTSSNVTAAISNIPSLAASASLPFESRSVGMTNGSFSDSFAAWGTHIYKMASAASLVAPELYSCGLNGGGSFTLVFSGANGQSYRVLASTNILSPLTNWVVLTHGTFGVSLTNFTDSAAASTARFYRLASP